MFWTFKAPYARLDESQPYKGVSFGVNVLAICLSNVLLDGSHAVWRIGRI